MVRGPLGFRGQSIIAHRPPRPIPDQAAAIRAGIPWTSPELFAFAVGKASDLHSPRRPAADDPVHGDVRRINLPPLEHKEVRAMKMTS